MKRQSIFFLLVLFFSLHADVMDHLQKITDKEDGHAIRNIDFIYMINLDERPEKFERSIKKLSPYGITPYRFSAVNGWNLSINVINDVGVKWEPWMMRGGLASFFLFKEDLHPYIESACKEGRTYFSYDQMTKAVIGIVLSHLSVLKDAYDSGYETIWVMEDDIQIEQDPHLVSTLIDQLDGLVGKANWDVLFTDIDSVDIETGTVLPNEGFSARPNFYPPNPFRFWERYEISSDFKKVGARFGAYSMVLRRSGIKKILDFFKEYQIYSPYDCDYAMPPSINLFSLNYNLVTHVFGSDVESDRIQPNFLEKKETQNIEEESHQEKSYENEVELKTKILADLIGEAKPKVVVGIELFEESSLARIYEMKPWDSVQLSQDYWGFCKENHQILLQTFMKKVTSINFSQSTLNISYDYDIDLLFIEGNPLSSFDLTKWGANIKTGGWIVLDKKESFYPCKDSKWFNENFVKVTEFIDESNPWELWSKL